jgi:hypothetical protein
MSPNTEKGGLCLVGVQDVEDPVRHPGRWSIIEREVDHAFRGRHAPQQITEQGFDQFGYPMEVHGLS